MTEPASIEINTPSETEVEISRLFQAPRALVFKAWTQPEYLRQWFLGPPGWSFPVCQVDLRVGGSYRYCWRNDDDGAEIVVSGIYTEVQPPARLVHTEAFEQAWYPGDAVVTTTFADVGEATLVVTTMRYETKEARDTVLASPMESGISASYDRLDNLLSSQVP